jgi:RNA polymerase sigma factor (sigma-70 family)
VSTYDPSAARTERRPAEDDRRLLERLRSGGRSALDEIWQRHSRPVTAFVFSRIAGRDDADELIQDVFVTLWRRRESIVIAGDSLLPWLLVTSRNLVANRRRRLAVEARRVAGPLADTEPSRSDGPEAAAEREELRRVVAGSVSRLSDVDRALFDLCLVEGRSYADAAEHLGISSGSLRNRLSRLRGHLRSELHTLRGTR